MTKVILNDVANLQNETTAVNTINTNSAVIETAFNNTLSRDGTSPNQMGASLDMNNNQIINIPAPSNLNSPLRLQDAISGITTITAATGTSGHTVPFLDGNNTWSGSNKFDPSVIREKLIGNRTYYVRTDGNDSNTGLTNTSGGAFLTITRAVTVVQRNLDCAGLNVNIQVANGTYNESVDFSTPVTGASCSGQLSVVGDPTTPSNVILSGGAFGFRVLGPGPDWLIQGFKIVTSSGPALFGHANGWLRAQNIEIGNCGGVNGIQIQADNGGTVEIQGNYTISAPAGYHVLTNTGGYFLNASGVATITGTPFFSNYFVYATSGSRVRWSGTFSGSATGTRYLIELNSTFVGNGSPLPGSVAGSTATGGQYNL